MVIQLINREYLKELHDKAYVNILCVPLVARLLHRFCLASEEGCKCPAEPMEQREQNHVLHELCRVATEEDESQIKEINEMLTGQVLLC